MLYIEESIEGAGLAGLGGVATRRRGRRGVRAEPRRVLIREVVFTRSGRCVIVSDMWGPWWALRGTNSEKGLIMPRARNQEGQRMLAGSRPAPQRNRQLLCRCNRCHFRMRASATCIAMGLPTCACGGGIELVEIRETMKGGRYDAR